MVQNEIINQVLTLTQGWERAHLEYYKSDPDKLTYGNRTRTIVRTLEDIAQRAQKVVQSIETDIAENPSEAALILYDKLSREILGPELLESILGSEKYGLIKESLDASRLGAIQSFDNFLEGGRSSDFVEGRQQMDKYPNFFQDSEILHDNMPIATINESALTLKDVPHTSNQIRTNSNPSRAPDLVSNTPLILYQHNLQGNQIILDVEEYQGSKGIPVYGIHSESGRAGVIFQDGQVIEQKGIMVGLHQAQPEMIHSATHQHYGLYPLANAEAEAQAINYLADLIGYSGNSFDLNFTVEKPFPQEMGVLERRGNAGEFAPNLRSSLFSQPAFLKKLLDAGFSIEDAFSHMGTTYGMFHNRDFYHLTPHAGNIEIHGSPMDFEGSVLPSNFSTYVRNYMDRADETMKHALDQWGFMLFEARDLDTILSGPNPKEIFGSSGGDGFGTIIATLRAELNRTPDEDLDRYAAPLQENILIGKFLTSYLRARGVTNSDAKTSQIMGQVKDKWSYMDTDKVLYAVHGNMAPKLDIPLNKSDFSPFAHLPNLL